MLRAFLLILILCPSIIFANPGNKYWIFFKEKPAKYSLDRPSEFLTAEALENRIRSNSSVTYSDIPVSSTYIHEIQKRAEVHVISKWFNAISISISEEGLSEIKTLPFVDRVEKVKKFRRISNKPLTPLNKTSELSTDYYGEAFTQIKMVKGNYLHQKNLQGSGIVIGVMDSGFKNANTNRAFERLRKENRLLGAFDLVEEDFDIFTQFSHGAWVLSVMAADLPGEIVGTAPLASYYIFRTEDATSETLMEEDNWVAAAEMADQFGVDILNTSLGYSTFDDSLDDHEYADLDGNTTIISKAADMAAKKGMLVVTSAGNEGNSSWFYITAPADGDSVLAVGAVNSEMEVASFSSHGPSSDGDVKPNICAMGSSTAVVNADGVVTKLSGTSFAAPVISGLAACLWQAFPEKTNMEIFNAIEQSANYTTPDNECGYGIPDFELAFNLLANDLIDILDSENTDLIISPNPVTSSTRIFYKAKKGGPHSVGLYDMRGKELYFDEQYLFSDQYNKINLDVQNLSRGVYVVRIIQTDVKIEGLLLKTP